MNISLINRMETYLASAGVSTGSIAILYVAYKVWKNVVGHRLVSDCCGKTYEVGVDVRNMPPTPPTGDAKAPPPQIITPE